MGKPRKKVRLASCRRYGGPVSALLNYAPVAVWERCARLQGKTGQAVEYISRTQALRKLQLKLPDFR